MARFIVCHGLFGACCLVASVVHADDGGQEATDVQGSPEVIEVQGQSQARALADSAKAVTVIDTTRDQKKAADLGEVLARTQGIGVQRASGLGSETRFSLNGLTDDQVRFFLDGVPLELMGFTFGIANVPLNVVDRVEVYRGVVPIEFGADALGGAVNLVSTLLDGTSGGASYQLGSFGTHRVTANSQVVDDESGFFTKLIGFYDVADNDYRVDVEIADELGRFSSERVERFHDGYQAVGANLEVGFVDTAWAERLSLTGFFSDFERDIQNNIIMRVPYGEVRSFGRTAGATLRYEQPLTDSVRLNVVSGYSRQRTRLLDRATCIYDWFGTCTGPRLSAGEIEPPPKDNVVNDDTVYARANAIVELAPDHELRLSLSPTYVTRNGEARLEDPDNRDPLSADRRLLTVVAGAEYETPLIDDRLDAIVFVKGYLQAARTEETLPGNVFQRLDRDTERGGLGTSLRFVVVDGFAIKASYEWATRLPRVDETFGDGALVLSNLQLSPETSHNLNFGGRWELDTSSGRVLVDINAFLREVSDQIVLQGNERSLFYRNLSSARSLGVEGVVEWTLPGDWLTVGGNGTYLDLRNTSDEGQFAEFEGDRVPNLPYLLANAFARTQVEEVFSEDDSVALDWNSRYVGEFFRNWESVGAREFKETVDTQFFHTAALIYSTRLGPADMSFTGEMQNITNERLFDFFGAQRPGRAFFIKTTGQF
ncbi:MAG: TonB-dependent siderophore myxochelin receptor MxcH [Myxococcota bacterium]